MKYFSISELLDLFPRANRLVLKELSNVKYYKKYDINTQERYIHFLSQMSHESMYFSKLKEVRSSASAERKYGVGTRVGKILGNTMRGDGSKFLGRGIIQLTGRYNYTVYAKKLSKALSTKIDLVQKPELLEQPGLGTLIAFEFWAAKDLNILCDTDNIKIRHRSLTKKINGGYNGLSARISEYDRLNNYYVKNIKSK